MPKEEIRQVLGEYTPDWLQIPGVQGTIIGSHEGRPCINVLVEARTRELERHIPDRIEGYPVKIIETGPIAPQD